MTYQINYEYFVVLLISYMETLIFDENNVQKLRHPYRHTLLFHGKDNCYIELQQSKLPAGTTFLSKYEEFEHTKGVTRTDNTMTERKRTKGQTTIYKTYINLKIE